MKTFIIVIASLIGLFIFAIVISIGIDYIKYKKARANKPKYLTTTSIITNRMPKLQGVKNCYWNGDAKNPDFDPISIGPTDYWYKGFIFITDTESTRINKKYKWEKVDANWKPSLDSTPLGTSHYNCNWTKSKEFTESIGVYWGDIYFDKTHSLLFFDLCTM
jgi:hypothetical protein